MPTTPPSLLDDILNSAPAAKVPGQPAAQRSLFDDLLDAAPPAGAGGVHGMEQLGGAPPGPVAPPINRQNIQYSDYGRVPVSEMGSIEGPMDTLPALEQIAGGAKKILTSGPTPTKKANLRQAASGGADVIHGAFQAAGPLAIPAFAANPVGTVATVLAASGADVGTSAGLKAVGVPEEYAQFAGAVAGALAGGATGHKAFKFLWEKAGSPEIKFGQFDTPKEFRDMTDEELVGHANKIAADPPKNYRWQKEQIVQEVARRTAERGMGAPEPGAQEVARTPQPPAPPPTPEDVLAQAPPVPTSPERTPPGTPQQSSEAAPVPPTEVVSQSAPEKPTSGLPPMEEQAYQAAVALVRGGAPATTSTIQRQLRMGYGAARRILDRMYREGITDEEGNVAQPATPPSPVPAQPVAGTPQSAVSVAPSAPAQEPAPAVPPAQTAEPSAAVPAPVAAQPDPNESVQDKSWREWAENFTRVSANPTAASEQDLRRAIGFLDNRRRSIIRRAQEAGQLVDANVLAGYDNESEYYLSLIKQHEAARTPKSVPPAPPRKEAIPAAKPEAVAETAGAKGAPPEQVAPQDTGIPPGTVPSSPTPETAAETPQASPSKPAAGSAVTESARGGEGEKHSYASTQVNLPDDVASKVRAVGASIPDDILTPDGRETKPHITVRFGNNEKNSSRIEKALQGQGPITAKVKTLSIFPNVDTEHGKADVLKLDIDSPELHRLNKLVGESVPHPGETHPDYKPHITVAYVKAGEGKKYAGRSVPGLSGQTITFDAVHFSPAEGEMTAIPLKAKAPEKPAPSEPMPASHWMNAGEIDQSLSRFKAHPVLSRATKFLSDLAEETNDHSDGWHSWPLPGHAAKQLMGIIQHPEYATEANFKKALGPIRAFYTKRGTAAGMQWPKVEGVEGLTAPKPAAKPAPAPTPVEKAANAVEAPKVEQILSAGAWADSFKNGDRLTYTWKGEAQTATVRSRDGDYLEVAPDGKDYQHRLLGTSARQADVQRVTPSATETKPAPTDTKAPVTEETPAKTETNSNPKLSPAAQSNGYVDRIVPAQQRLYAAQYRRFLMGERPEPGWHGSGNDGTWPDLTSAKALEVRLAIGEMFGKDLQAIQKEWIDNNGPAAKPQPLPAKAEPEPKKPEPEVSPESRKLADKAVAKAVDDLIDAADRASRSTKSGSAMAEIEAERLRQFIRNGKEYAGSPLAKNADPKQVAVLRRTVELAEKVLGEVEKAAKPEPEAVQPSAVERPNLSEEQRVAIDTPDGRVRSGVVTHPTLPGSAKDFVRVRFDDDGTEKSVHWTRVSPNEPTKKLSGGAQAPSELHESLAQSGFDKPYADLTPGQKETIELRAARRNAPIQAPEKKPVTPQIPTGAAEKPKPADLASALGFDAEDIINAAAADLEAAKPASKRPQPPPPSRRGTDSDTALRRAGLTPSATPIDPGYKPTKTANPLAAAAEAAEGDFLAKWGKKGPAPVQSRGESPIDRDDLKNLTVMGARRILDGATDYKEWADGMASGPIGGALEAMAEHVGMTPAEVLRQIHQMSATVAKRFGVQASTPPAAKASTIQPEEQTNAEPALTTEPAANESVSAEDRKPLAEQLPEADQGAGEGRPTSVGGGARSKRVRKDTGAGTPEDGVQPSTGTVSGVVGDAAEPERTFPPRAQDVVSTRHDRDYRIPDGRVVSGSPEARAKTNIKVIRTLREIQQENRPATLAEMDILSGYVGWGAVPQLFAGSTPDFQKLQDDLKSLLNDEEYASAQRSTTNAHYTGDQHVDAIWNTLVKMGAKPGMSWMEPAVGIGTFFGRQPAALLEGARRVGIDKDAISGQIAKLLYPDSGIDIMGFEESELPADYFDGIASNVPFGDFGVHDPAFRGKPFLTSSIHNYYFAKSITLTRPGGIVAFITSRYTMDGYSKTHTALRSWLNERADFLGSVRLPAGAFRQNAGTDVITDIIFLRRRLPNAEPAGEDWLGTNEKTLKHEKAEYWDRGTPIAVNQYYHDHPEMVLGKEGLNRGQFSANDYNVKGTLDQEQLESALAKIAEKGGFQEYAPGKKGRAVAVRELNAPEAITSKLGGLFFDDKGNLFRRTSKGTAEPIDAAGPLKSRIKASLVVRDVLAKLLDAELADKPDGELKTLRRNLNGAYDGFVKNYGYLSSQANLKAMDGDPDAPLLLSLERGYNKGNKAKGAQPTAEKAPIFERRMLQPAKAPTSVNDPKEALYIALNEKGRLDWERMSELTGRTQEQLQSDLHGLVYRDPETKVWQTAEEYLSGSVRNKLKQARAIAKVEPEFKENVKALENVQPEDIPPGEISAQLGVTWVPIDTYTQFAAEMLGATSPDRMSVKYAGGEWMVDAGYQRLDNLQKWSTARVSGTDLLRDTLNMRRTKVYDRDSDGTVTINADETKSARARQMEMQEHFEKWMFSEPKRGDELARLYNDLHNDLRLRTYDGGHLTLPGMTRDAVVVRGGDLDPHQKAAVWRQIVQPNVLLAHSVGSGKAQPLDAKILTPNGWKRMGDILPGDHVIAGDGSPTLVEAVFPQGEKDIYRVEFSDGSATETCDEHLWLTHTYAERSVAGEAKRRGKNWDCAKPEVRSLAEIKTTLIDPHLGAKNHSIPMVGVVQFAPQNVPLDPYLVGVLLGDGCLRGTGTVGLSTADDELLDHVRNVLPPGCEIRHRAAYDYAICQTVAMQWAVGGGFTATHPVVGPLKSLGMYGKYAHEKAVPQSYLFNSSAVRLGVLQGLMDTDGTVGKSGTSVTFTSTSAALAEAIVFLVESFGGTLTRREKRPRFTYKGVQRIGRTAYELHICLPPDVPPFRLSRKASAVRPKSKYRPVRYITAVAPVGRKLAKCIRVAHPSHLYVTDRFIVTHNTFEMIAAGMELKRLGLIRRPMYVVPNATLTGWQEQFAALYPQKRVLVFSEKDLERSRRQQIMAQIATGDWDAVVVPHSSFQFLPTGDDIFDQHYKKLEAELEESIKEAEDAGIDSRQIKRMEKAKERLLTSLKDKRNADKKDQTVTWEQLGIDQLFVDESHEYKKLGFSTKQGNVAGIDQNGNQKTFDLLMKLRYTQQHGRGVTFATGTPVTNTMGELFSIMKYLVEKELSARGMGRFDEWASNYGRTVDVFEPKIEGGGYQLKARFAQFVNLPELAQLFRSFADVVTSDMIDIPRPKIATGARQPVEQQLSDLQRQILEEDLQPRAKNIRANPKNAMPDNMLAVYMDAQKMALDPRMMVPSAPDNPVGRLNMAADLIAKHWKDSAKSRGTQLVFSDLGKPAEAGGSREFSVYDELIRKLIERGIPREEIAHIYQAKNKAQRTRLFQEVNDGKIRVLLGSTPKMGVGVNVQKKLYALHHLDIPHRPSDLEQREGRILRQGNENPEVHIHYYVTKGSLDEAKFGNVVRKAKFINQVMQGKSTVREAEDVGGMVPSLEMFQAMASGDPRVMRKMEVDAEVDRLSGVYSGWKNQQYQIRGQISSIQGAEPYLRRQIGQIQGEIATRDKTGDVWELAKHTSLLERLTSKGEKFEEFSGEKIGKEVNAAMAKLVMDVQRRKPKEIELLGHAYGLPIRAEVKTHREAITISVGEFNYFDVPLSDTETEKTEKIDFHRRTANTVRELEGFIHRREQEIEQGKDKAERLGGAIEEHWPYTEKLVAMIEEQKKLIKELGADKGDDAAVAVGDSGEVADARVEAQEQEPSEDEEDGEEDDNEGPKPPQPPAKKPPAQAGEVFRGNDPQQLASVLRPISTAPKPRLSSAWTGNVAAADGAYVTNGAMAISAESIKDPGILSKLRDKKDIVQTVADAPIQKMFDERAAASSMPLKPLGYARVERLNAKPKEKGNDRNADAAYFADDTGKVYPLDSDYLQIIQQAVGPTEAFGSGNPKLPVAFKRNGDTLAILMPMNTEVVPLPAVEGPAPLQSRRPMPGFYSALERAVESKMPEKASANQIDGIVKNPQNGVKPDEIKWTGLGEWLAQQKGPITKAQALEFIRQNNVQVEEVPLGFDPEVESEANALRERGRALQAEYDELNSNGDDMPTNDELMEVANPGAGWTPNDPQNRLDELEAQIQDINDELDAIEKNPGAEKPTKFGQYVLPGGQNYRELLLTLPAEGLSPKIGITTDVNGRYGLLDLGTREILKGSDGEEFWTNSAEKAEKMRDWWNKNKNIGYRSSHWDEPNVLAHVRFDERTGPGGEKILHVAEIQSDWHQQGRRQGYQLSEKEWTPADRSRIEELVANEHGLDEQQRQELAALREKGRRILKKEGVPNAPFAKSWPELAFRRMLRYAAENGYDKLTWDTGETSAARYDLSKQVKSIEWLPRREDGERQVTITPNDGNPIEFIVGRDGIVAGFQGPGSGGEFDGKHITDVVGKDIGDQIVSEKSGDLSGNGLKVGGEGMKGFYDQILPAYAAKIGKKWGAKVGDVEIAEGARDRNAELAPEKWKELKSLLRAEDDLGFSNSSGALLAVAQHRDWSNRWEIANPRLKELLREYRALQRPAVTAHGIDITPAMKASVMQGQPLFARQKPGATSTPQIPGRPPRLQESPVPAGDFPTLKETKAYWDGAVAQPDTIKGQPVLWVNGSAMDVILSRMGMTGSGQDSTQTIGLMMTPGEWLNVLDEARAAGRSPRPGGFDAALARIGKQMEDVLRLNEPGASRRMPLVVAQAGDSIKPEMITRTLNEELDHAKQLQLPKGLRGLPVEMLESPEGEKAVDALVKAQGYRRPDSKSPFYEHNRAVMTAEIGVRLMRGGRYQELGLTAEEAVELAAQYIEGLERANGANADQIIEQTYATIEQNKAAYSGRSKNLDVQHETGAERAPQGRTQGATESPEGAVPGETGGSGPVAVRASSGSVFRSLQNQLAGLFRGIPEPAIPPEVKPEWVLEVERELGLAKPSQEPAPLPENSHQVFDTETGRIRDHGLTEKEAKKAAASLTDLTGAEHAHRQVDTRPEPAEEFPHQIKESRLAQGVEKNAIAEGLTEGFEGRPEYRTVNIKEQAQLAADLIARDLPKALRVAMGADIPPGALLPESVFVAVENYATEHGDVELLRQLATTSTLSMEATGMGQRIRMLGERRPNSPVEAMKKVTEAREAASTKRNGPKAKEKAKSEIKESIKTANRKKGDWASFIESIKC